MFRSGRGVDGPLTTSYGHLEFFNVALWHNARIALLQFAFGVDFIRSLLQGAFCFLELAFRLKNIGLRRQHGGIDFGDFPVGRLQ